jgi:RNA polymerase sigma-70 factor (ECF subfamily)
MSSLPSTPQFEQTRWSLILRARSEDDAARRQALEDLCRAYWYPLYAYLRRSGNSTEDAQDLAQDFFARLMDGTLLSAAEPAKGRFRTLLLATLKNLATNTWRATQRQKRGGGVEIISLDIAMAEDRWQAEPAGGPPEAAFDRAWAHTVIDRAGGRLQSEYVAGGRAELFAELFPRLNGGHAADGLSSVAARLGMTEAAVKMALSRMRQRYGDALREEIAQTVGSQCDAQDELRYLLAVFL